MKSTQLYLDGDLWHALHACSRQDRTTISDLVRRAAREKYLGNFDERRKAMMAVVGLRRNRSDIRDATEYVREVRRDRRMERLRNKMSVLIDSDILIEVTRGRDPRILSMWDELSRSEEEVSYSLVTAVEVWCGARPHESEALNHLFETMLCVPIDCDTGRLAGTYLRAYRKSHAVALGDALIAATAAVTHAELWTRGS